MAGAVTAPAKDRPGRLLAATDQSGLYRAKIGGARGDLFFAVNPPSGGAESDLRRATADDIRRQSAEDVQVVTDLGSIRHAPKRLDWPTS